MTQKRAYISLLFSIFFQSGSVILGKKAAIELENFTVSDILHNIYFYGDLICLGCHAITWQIALIALPLFYAYLCMSIIYVVILISGYLFFNESIGFANFFGAFCIMAGVVVINHE